MQSNKQFPKYASIHENTNEGTYQSEAKNQIELDFLAKARNILLQLQAEALILDLDKAEMHLSVCQTEVSAIRSLKETFSTRQFRRVPHGVIPDQPIYSQYK